LRCVSLVPAIRGNREADDRPDMAAGHKERALSGPQERETVAIRPGSGAKK